MEPKVKYIKPDAFLVGVPARDLTPEDWDVMSDEQRAACIDSGAYELVTAEATARADKGD